MVRLMLVVAAIAAGIVFAKGRLDDADGGGSAIATPPAATAQVPAQFRTILASQPDPMTILRQRGALPGLGAIQPARGGRATGEAPSAPAPVRRRRQPGGAEGRCAATSAATSAR